MRGRIQLKVKVAELNLIWALSVVARHVVLQAILKGICRSQPASSLYRPPIDATLRAENHDSLDSKSTFQVSNSI